MATWTFCHWQSLTLLVPFLHRIAVAILWRNGWRKLAIALINIEVITYLVLSVLILGWRSGAQYALFLLVLGNLLIAWWSKWITIALIAMYTLIFILLYFYTQASTPLISNPQVNSIFHTVSIAFWFFMFALAILYMNFVIERAEEALEAEYARSESLLHNILPKPIAARLKQDESTLADDYSSASILFADIVGFTPLSQQLEAKQLVDILDTIFSRFDELVDKYGLEKIKTIGGGYMVATGIPIPRDDHAEALAFFALAMREALAEYNQNARTNLELRIGLNSGPVVAGVIGKHRFIYDLWGDSVNTAARMESHGRIGEIQITEATRKLLDSRFSFADRGIIEVKGKGSMQTYFLLGANGSSAAGHTFSFHATD